MSARTPATVSGGVGAGGTVRVVFAESPFGWTTRIGRAIVQTSVRAGVFIWTASCSGIGDIKALASVRTPATVFGGVGAGGTVRIVFAESVCFSRTVDGGPEVQTTISACCVQVKAEVSVVGNRVARATLCAPAAIVRRTHATTTVRVVLAERAFWWTVRV